MKLSFDDERNIDVLGRPLEVNTAGAGADATDSSAAGDEAILLAVVGEREAHVERDLLGYGTLVTTP